MPAYLSIPVVPLSEDADVHVLPELNASSNPTIKSSAYIQMIYKSFVQCVVHK